MQPKITGDQITKSIQDTGTVFPASPVVGQEFFLTADLFSTGGSPLYPTHFKGSFTYDGADWVSKPKSTTSGDGWDEMLSPNVFVDTSAPGTAPDWEIFRDGIRQFAFDDTAEEHAWWSVHLPHDWVIGTSLYPHVHWSHNNPNPTGVVRWGIEYTMARGYGLDAFPATVTVYLEEDAGVGGAGSPAAGVQYQHFITEFSEAQAIDMSSMDIDGTVHFRIFRDATHINDTFSGDAFVLFTDVHYQSDRLTTPQRNYPFTKLT